MIYTLSEHAKEEAVRILQEKGYTYKNEKWKPPIENKIIPRRIFNKMSTEEKTLFLMGGGKIHTK